MAWIDANEAHALWRDTYTWDALVSELAYTTQLTLAEANTIRHDVDAFGIHPADAKPMLEDLFSNTTGLPTKSLALKELITAAINET